MNNDDEDDDVIIIDDDLDEPKDVVDLSSDSDDCQIADIVMNEVLYDGHVINKPGTARNKVRNRRTSLSNTSKQIKLEKSSTSTNKIKTNSETITAEAKAEVKSPIEASTETEIFFHTQVSPMNDHSTNNNYIVDLEMTNTSNISIPNDICNIPSSKPHTKKVPIDIIQETIKSCDKSSYFDHTKNEQMECETNQQNDNPKADSQEKVVFNSELSAAKVSKAETVTSVSRKSDACIQTSPIESSTDADTFSMNDSLVNQTDVTNKSIDIDPNSTNVDESINSENQTSFTESKARSHSNSILSNLQSSMNSKGEKLQNSKMQTLSQSCVYNTDTKTEVYVCSWNNCEKVFMNALLHYKHEKKHLRDSKKNGLKLFQCRKCDFSAFTFSDLIFHNSEHNKMYFCRFDNCLFKDNCKERLNDHMKKHEIGKCSDCRILSSCDCGENCCTN